MLSWGLQWGMGHDVVMGPRDEVIGSSQHHQKLQNHIILVRLCTPTDQTHINNPVGLHVLSCCVLSCVCTKSLFLIRMSETAVIKMQTPAGESQSNVKRRFIHSHKFYPESSEYILRMLPLQLLTHMSLCKCVFVWPSNYNLELVVLTEANLIFLSLPETFNVHDFWFP